MSRPTPLRSAVPPESLQAALRRARQRDRLPETTRDVERCLASAFVAGVVQAGLPSLRCLLRNLERDVRAPARSLFTKVRAEFDASKTLSSSGLQRLQDVVMQTYGPAVGGGEDGHLRRMLRAGGFVRRPVPDDFLWRSLRPGEMFVLKGSLHALLVARDARGEFFLFDSDRDGPTIVSERTQPRLFSKYLPKASLGPWYVLGETIFRRPSG